MTIDPTQDTPGVAPPLDPELMRTIRASASRMMLLEGTFISQLHGDVIALVPELAANGRVFCERMVRSVLWAAVTDQPPMVVADTLRWVGATNWMEGFPESGYTSVAHALVRTVRGLSGDSWSTSMGSAWITYFMWIQPQLLIGAGRAIAQRQAAAQRQAQAPSGEVSLNSAPGMPAPGMPAPGMPAPGMPAPGMPTGMEE